MEVSNFRPGNEGGSCALVGECNMLTGWRWLVHKESETLSLLLPKSLWFMPGFGDKGGLTLIINHDLFWAASQVSVNGIKIPR